MDKEVTEKYIKNVEERIVPGKVAAVYQGAEFLRKLPQSIQRRIVSKNSRKEPYMGFVVEPYSFFLAYEIDEHMVKGYLPDTYELIPVSLFEKSEEKLCAVAGCFTVHTSVFWGTRIELYIIAKNKASGLPSWIICDYESNTINYEPGKGFLPPTVKKCIYTTSYDGEIICDIESEKGSNKIDLTADITSYNRTALSRKVWIEGNLSIDYAGELDNAGGEPFGLIFDPAEMGYAQSVADDKIHIREINFGFIRTGMRPFEACCFPYAQHYITTVIPEGHEMKNEKDLEDCIYRIINNTPALPQE